MPEPIRILVADDEQVARQRLTRLLGALDDVTVSGEAKDGGEVLAKVKAGGIDLVLLDIRMPGLTGVEALKLMPVDGPLVVFCTAHSDHAVDAFDGGAVDYLLKPVDAARLARAVERARQRLLSKRAPEAARSGSGRANKLPIQTRQGIVLVDPGDVTHAVLEDELVRVSLKGGVEHLSDFTLQEVQDRLGSGPFVRVHRRALVNLDQVVRLEPIETGGFLARLVTGKSVEVSRQAARDLRKALGLRRGSDDDAG